MRNHLAKFLLLLVTVSGTIMPIHAYAHESTESQERHSAEFTKELTNLDEHHEKATDSATCDHCCHFSSHAVGLIRASSRDLELKATIAPISLNQNYTSHQQAPPYHPPIA